jgi:glutamine synthetase
MINIPELFGSMVFNDTVMRERLPAPVYTALKNAAYLGARLDSDTAGIVACAMKDWAVENGATHYAHWFQPMTGVTAGKLDSFISPAPDGKVIMEFSGSALVRGEPDASSFPSGGLRATFEARGYTVWDISSYAFIKDGALMIPTVFCSHSGEALDKKTPLLRSMEALDKQARRILALFGNDQTARVVATAGAEQEYFLIDKDVFLRRPDLVYTGRTLFGARPPKGQELDDHYFGCLKPRVSAFMKELDEELWKLGVYAKTKHNETAPAQHELAPVFTSANIAADHNQLTMELMKSVADKHGLACLLHEKPFAGVNGSGKHNNWSIAGDGSNLLEPGDTPFENAQFLLFLVAVIKAVDEHQDLLRASVASAGNDHRLGGNEAPPAIISIFLGDELTEILEAVESGTVYHNKEKQPMEIGVTMLPRFPKDITDRNRTSPFAFTGDKFEFRMLGSSFSIAEPNTVLNTSVADVLKGFACRLEGAEDFRAELAALIKETISAHKRIIFNGNSYCGEWALEAERRGLSNLKTTADALPALISRKSVALFGAHNVYSEAELASRAEILTEEYCKTLHIEALAMIELIKGGILPACIAYQSEAAALLTHKRALGGFDCSPENTLLLKISDLSARLLKLTIKLEQAVADEKQGYAENACYYRDTVAPCMSELRSVTDRLESITAKKHWPLPGYGDMLYSVI